MRLQPLTNPFDRNVIPPETKEIIRKTLESSRQLSRVFPEHLTFRQAIRNSCMAYSIVEAPAPEELRFFFPSISVSNDIAVTRHFDSLSARLSAVIGADWMSKFMESRVAAIRSAPSHRREEIAESAGFDSSGYMNSGLVWATGQSKLDYAWIPCIDIENIFLHESEPKNSETGTREAHGYRFPSFLAELRKVTRDCVNETRVAVGLPRIGEGWVSETELYHQIKSLLPNETVRHHGRPEWIGRQHLDVWIPSRNIAFEYHGQQHFEAVEFFGGETGLAATRQRDKRKRSLCERNGVRLVEVSYNEALTDEELIKLITKQRTILEHQDR